MKEKLVVSLSPKKIIRFFLLVILGFALINFVGQYHRYFLSGSGLIAKLLNIFNVDQERSIPTLYSVIALQFCSLLLAIIAYITKLTKKSYVRDWQALSFVFLYLSFDEFFELHEKLIDPLQSAFNFTGFLRFAWVIPGAIFVIICLLLFLRLLLALPAQIRNLFLLAGAVYIAGALGMESFSAYTLDTFGETNFVYTVIAICEEILEMLGVIIFIYALLNYIRLETKQLTIDLKD